MWIKNISFFPALHSQTKQDGESFITVKWNLVIFPNLLTQKCMTNNFRMTLHIDMDKRRWRWFASSFYVRVSWKQLFRCC